MQNTWLENRLKKYIDEKLESFTPEGGGSGGGGNVLILSVRADTTTDLTATRYYLSETYSTILNALKNGVVRIVTGFIETSNGIVDNSELVMISYNVDACIKETDFPGGAGFIVIPNSATVQAFNSRFESFITTEENGFPYVEIANTQ